MPIAIGFLIFGELILDLPMRVSFEPARSAGPAKAEDQRAELEKAIRRRLPARLVRDVLPD